MGCSFRVYIILWRWYKSSIISNRMDTFDNVDSFNREDVQLFDSLLDDVRVVRFQSYSMVIWSCVFWRLHWNVQGPQELQEPILLTEGRVGAPPPFYSYGQLNIINSLWCELYIVHTWVVSSNFRLVKTALRRTVFTIRITACNYRLY